MKIYRFRFVIIGVIMALALGIYLPQQTDTNKKDKAILNLVYNVLNSRHYAPQEINNEFSAQVFDHFIENLDYSKRFLLKEDLEKLNVYRDKLDEEIKEAELNFFEEAFSIYNQRFEQAKSYYTEVLAQPFDFTLEETLQTDDEKLELAGSEKELKDRWRKYLKNRVLMRVEERIEDQEIAKERKDTTIEEIGFEQLEAEAREKELELHDDWFESLSDLERMDWVSMYVNAITTSYDPHTQYFPPERQEDFEISMTGQLEGIGAQLQQKGDYVVIAKIITGSACWKQGDLEVGDKILKVAQEDQADEEAVDVVGMKVRNVVKYIRGPKGTEVRLTVQKLDGSKMVIPIVRDVVELEATFAKSAVLGEGENKIGYIKLPKFYVDFYGEDNHNAAEDVKKELQKLKEENVKGVILDLRNNGGGSLAAVIDIVGLFIEDGPVVQVRTSGEDVQVLKDRDDDIHYDGPLVVMVNQFSASASEIFAAAIQDYNRGLILGSKSTFGKGTVQNVLDMDKAFNFTYNDIKPLGALKLTIQKYYRIDGGTPQLKGVHPDVVFPDNFSYIEFGEKEQDNALPYDEIEPAKYDLWKKGANKYSKAIEASNNRVSSHPKFQLIDEYARWLEEQQKDSEISLNFEKYRTEQEQFRKRSKKYDNMRRSEDSLTVSMNQADVEHWTSSEDREIERDRWFKSVRRDLYLGEAYRIGLDLN